MQTDTLIHARWIVPVVPDGAVLDHHSIAIHDGRIQAILPAAEARETCSANTIIERPAHALIPGLVNAHTHSPMTLLRGLADDLPLGEWLHEHIWPAESQWVSEEFVVDGTRLAAAEMLRGGTTCFNDMYYFPDATARAALECGIRACVGLIVVDFPSAWASNADEYLTKGLALRDTYRGHPLIRTAFAPHATYTVATDVLARVRVLSDEMDLSVHMHVHETADEVRQVEAQYGTRPLQHLHELGLVSPSLLAVHMTQASDEEIDAFATAGGHIVHCPESNLKLASGFCRTARWLDAGVNVALGTDGAASNNDLDMFSEMRTAALLAKGVAQDAGALPAGQVLRMATLNGARALGLDAETGSLETGKSADMVAVRLDAPRSQPVYNPVSQLVYACNSEQVTDTWVAGKHLLNDGELTTLDEEDVITRARAWADRIGA